tara:strand:- start:276 stop:506 length:231 start_codon:yes stop_codon:yes gene_type:complete
MNLDENIIKLEEFDWDVVRTAEKYDELNDTMHGLYKLLLNIRVNYSESEEFIRKYGAKIYYLYIIRFYITIYLYYK